MTQKKLTKKLQDEALAEDPSIFQYDEVYDEIDNKRKEAKLAKKSTEAKAPKYIGKLLETAEKRKKENERRIERQVQKEREAEGEQFKDKEAFVTSSYRKKLEEMKEAEEKEKREAYLENIGDVTKQQDLSGFYRHIYEQKVTPDGKAATETVVKVEPEEKPAEPQPETSKKKNYRKRKSSADQNEESDKEDKGAKVDGDSKAHLVSNLDADSDFSIDSSDSEDEKGDKKKPKEIKQEPVDGPPQEPKVETNGKVEADPEVKVEETPIEPPKPKIDIWKKRTVGEVLDEALARYYQRKAERERAA